MTVLRLSEQGSSKGRRRVLLVEDHTAFRQALGGIASTDGWASGWCHKPRHARPRAGKASSTFEEAVVDPSMQTDTVWDLVVARAAPTCAGLLALIRGGTFTSGTSWRRPSARMR